MSYRTDAICRWCGKTYSEHAESRAEGAPYPKFPCRLLKSGFKLSEDVERDAEALARHDEERQALLDLLAVCCGDGGHYAEKRGIVEACEYARGRVDAWRSAWVDRWRKVPPEPAFKEFVETQRQASPQEHAEIDQRAAPSAIIAEDAAEAAKLEGNERTGLVDLLRSVLKYLDYQRAQLTIRQPEGDSGDILWLVNKVLSNAGVSPEKSLISAIQKLAEFQVDLYAQNAKIRRRLEQLEAHKAYSDEVHRALLDCFEHRNHDGYEYPPILEAIFQKFREAEKERENGKGE